MKLSMIGSIALAAWAGAAIANAGLAATLTVPSTVQLPQLEPLVPACADPAADHFLEVDISKRPPQGAARVQRLSAWVTPDGVFHWPFVMRIRNIGDQPFTGSAGKQSAVVTVDDLKAKTKGTVASAVAFDRIQPHSGVAVRFEFSAPAEAVQKAAFHRVYTLAIKYGELNEAIVTGRNGDCNLLNNSFSVEFDGSRKGWIFAK